MRAPACATGAAPHRSRSNNDLETTPRLDDGCRSASIETCRQLAIGTSRMRTTSQRRSSRSSPSRRRMARSLGPDRVPRSIVSSSSSSVLQALESRLPRLRLISWRASASRISAVCALAPWVGCGLLDVVRVAPGPKPSARTMPDTRPDRGVADPSSRSSRAGAAGAQEALEERGLVAVQGQTGRR